MIRAALLGAVLGTVLFAGCTTTTTRFEVVDGRCYRTTETRTLGMGGTKTVAATAESCAASGVEVTP